MEHQGPISNDDVIEMLRGLSITLRLQCQLVESLIERMRLTSKAKHSPTLKIAKPKQKRNQRDKGRCDE